MVTVVQAKKYRSRPINLDTVAALFGNAVANKANRGILATTSRFQPAAKKFALSVSSDVSFPEIDLVDSNRVGEWCADIAAELDRYFSNGETHAPPIITAEHLSGFTGRIVVASGGYDMVINYFARIVADFPLQVYASQCSKGDGMTGPFIFGEVVACIRLGRNATAFRLLRLATLAARFKRDNGFYRVRTVNRSNNVEALLESLPV
jgi:hypothetical protein